MVEEEVVAATTIGERLEAAHRHLVDMREATTVALRARNELIVEAIEEHGCTARSIERRLHLAHSTVLDILASA